MKRIALIYDVDGWAWHKRALGIQKFAPVEYAVEVLAHSKQNFAYLEAQQADYDAILVMGWYDSLYNLSVSPDSNVWGLVASTGAVEQFPHVGQSLRKRTSSRSQNYHKAGMRFPTFRGLICINPLIVDACREFNSRTRFLYTGVDHTLFYPEQDYAEPDNCRDKSFQIGWCGKRPDGDRWTPKGWDEVLCPLMRQCAEDRDCRRWKFNTNTRIYSNRLNDHEMLHWHRSNHVFLCTSSYEGTPTTVLEAMSCGVPIVSTKVGIVGHAVTATDGEIDAGMVVPAYDSLREAKHRVRSLIACLKTLDNSRQGLAAMRVTARRRITDELCWRKLAPLWCRTLVGVEIPESEPFSSGP